ncbi:MAG: PAS domain-containing protein [Pseudomonadota bacterium]
MNASLIPAALSSPAIGQSAQSFQHLSTDTLAEVLDLLQMGVIIVDANFQILNINQTAKRMVSRQDGVIMRDLTSLTAQRDHDQDNLNNALTAALAGKVGAAALWPEGSGHPYLVTCAALGSSALHTETRILVTVTDPGMVPDEAVLSCGRALGLTPGESRLSLALVRGDSVTDHAERRGVSVHTVRSQLRSVREKLGLKRQSQLVAWLCRAALLGPSALRAA